MYFRPVLENKGLLFWFHIFIFPFFFVRYFFYFTAFNDFSRNLLHHWILHNTVILPRLNASRVLFGLGGYTGLSAFSRICIRLKVMASLWIWNSLSVLNSIVKVGTQLILQKKKIPIAVYLLRILNARSSYSTLTSFALLVCIRNNSAPVYQFVFEPENCLSSMFWPKTVCTPYAWTKRNYAGPK